MPDLIDSHCHLDYAPMSDDVGAALARAAAHGVTQVVHIGCSVERLTPALALVAAHEHVFTSLGIHPHDAVDYDDAVEARLREGSRHAKVVAIGETGLDYFYDRSPREVQRDAFARQITLARELDLPAVLHIRDAHADAWDVLDAVTVRDDPGIVHCFTGGADDARAWLDRGWHISFSGIATFGNATAIRDAARLCPDDRLLIETDAPFLAPVPMRGRKNEPAFVAYTCAALAELRGADPAIFGAQTARNTRRLLRLPPVASNAYADGHPNGHPNGQSGGQSGADSAGM
jgi:TatD DNase family protein